MKHQPDTESKKLPGPAHRGRSADKADAESRRKRLLAQWQNLLFLLLFGGLVGAAFGVTIGLSRDLPQIQNLENFKPMLSSLLYSYDGQPLADFGIERRQRTSLARIPIRLRQAVISVEDQYFYSHFGVNPAGTIRISA
jgi:penicillin-binding protein 1A